MTKVLDHGYIKLIDRWGSDEGIIEAARMSTAKGFLGWGPVARCQTCDAAFDSEAGLARCTKPSPGREYVETGRGGHIFHDVAGDEKLLRFLYENKHATPFEMAGATIEVQAPIFVFREWHRHRTQSYNEMSARYIPLPDVNYLPSVERLMINSKTNKQAGTIKGADELTADAAVRFQNELLVIYAEQQLLYERALASGVPKELARVHLPVGRYSRMRASANLRNWLAFLTLRMAPAAQWEIRQYAHALSEILAAEFPRTHALFSESAGRR